MPHYYSLGQIPAKRHVQFRRPDGGLYSEELVSSEGFASMGTLIYHVHPPTVIDAIGESVSVAPEVALDQNIQHRSFQGFQVPPTDDYLESRVILMTNHELQISLSAPRKSMDYFFKNAQSDEMIFVHEGTGTLKSIYGDLRFGGGDYLIIPRGTIYQFEWDTEDNRLLIVESNGPIVTPKRYRNEFGQLLEHAPFCERDLRKPSDLKTYDEEGEFPIRIKKQDTIHTLVYAYHPFDAIGWDGYLYPYAFSIHEFEPITGRVHQPPPVHQTFTGRGFVICSFCPRLYDYHPEAIPAPYNHSNIDSDEVLYYVDGDFMSRKHVERGMLTLHPMGIPHGPHPGTVEKSIGKQGTAELAVMIDTFNPLKITQQALQLEDPEYYRSWKS